MGKYLTRIRIASAPLRQQAIERTKKETLDPYGVWGIGKSLREQGMRSRGELEVRDLAREAKRRLSLLRAVDGR